MSLCPCKSQYRTASGLVGYGGVVGGVACVGPSLEEQHKAAEKELDAAHAEVRSRRHALSLAVKASDGSREDLDALDGMFVAWRDARAIAQGAASICENLLAMKSKKEGVSNG